MISIISIATALLQAINFWLISQGRLLESYIVTLAVGTGYAVVEIWLARLTGRKGLWAFVALDGWYIVCAINGLRRLT